jgi:hypothetical protein
MPTYAGRMPAPRIRRVYLSAASFSATSPAK